MTYRAIDGGWFCLRCGSFSLDIGNHIDPDCPLGVLEKRSQARRKAEIARIFNNADNHTSTGGGGKCGDEFTNH